jgi:2-keto-4-pentenoate hydratase/2-oxohepta-3-ene-1,7-dioic acid hydratase in catechol pathway
VKLCRFLEGDGARRLGLVEEERVIDLSARAPELPAEPAAALVAAGGVDALAEIGAGSDRSLPLEEVRLLSPALPRKYLAIALNYADHIAETDLEAPKVPTFFNKQATCVIGPDAGIHKPEVSDRLDYEGELAVVIGRRCRHVAVEEAGEAIAGYTIANDVSVRDWQMRAMTMTIGKSFDTHGPLGPWLVTGDELGDPQRLGIRTFVNGEQRQNGSTADMVFDCAEQVSHLSEAFTLEPGDVIATGTPAGVGSAVKPFPEGLLKVGDVVRIEIDGIGELRNEVVPEPDGFMVREEDPVRGSAGRYAEGS